MLKNIIVKEKFKYKSFSLKGVCGFPYLGGFERRKKKVFQFTITIILEKVL